MREGVEPLLGKKGGGCPSWKVGRIQENKANLQLPHYLVFHIQVNSVFLSREQMGR